MFSRQVTRPAARAARRTRRVSNAPQLAVHLEQPSLTKNLQPCIGRRYQSGKGAGKGAFWGDVKRGFRENYEKSPITFPLALFSIAVGAVLLLSTPKLYYMYVVKPFHNYPEEVAKYLRRALHYSSTELDPKKALDNYKQALIVADEIGMDPFSDEMMGVKIQAAALMEDVKAFENAIMVLFGLKRDALIWMDTYGDKHWNDGKRTRVLKKCVQLSVKLADIYANPWVWNQMAAEEQLVWALETALGERQRRQKEGQKEGEGDWLSGEEMGATMEQLGHTYEQKNDHYLATPLFLHALTLSPPKSCHSVVIMNNLATSISQQKPPAPPVTHKPAQRQQKSLINKTDEKPQGADPKYFPTSEGPSREALVAQAQLWGQKALALADSIQGEDRTEECDVGCAVATHNLGEFSERLGDLKGAQKRYQEARTLAGKLDFTDGIRNATEGLTRLKKKEKQNA